MRVETLRIIDKHIGVPLCWCLTWWDRLISRRKPASEPTDILVIQLSEMGSLALAAPAIRELQREMPNVRVHFLVFERNRQFLEILNLVKPEDIWTLDDSSLGAFMRSVRQFRSRALGRQIDVTLDFEIFSRASAILGWISGAARRVGFHNYRAEGLYRGDLLTQPVNYNTHQHISLNFAAQTRALMDTVRDGDIEQPALKRPMSNLDLSLPEIAIDNEIRADLIERLRAVCPAFDPDKPMLVFSPFSGNLLPIRAWPAGHYAELLRKFLDRHDATAVIVGLPEAREFCAPIFHELRHERLADFIGKTRDVNELMHLLSLARAFVASDSGPPHFAALVGTPSVVMFGPECPMLYGPLGDKTRTLYRALHCSPCVTAFNHRDTPCDNNVCMQTITPDDVLAALEAQLEA